jgi:hypothetical protein
MGEEAFARWQRAIAIRGIGEQGRLDQCRGHGVQH